MPVWRGKCCDCTRFVAEAPLEATACSVHGVRTVCVAQCGPHGAQCARSGHAVCTQCAQCTRSYAQCTHSVRTVCTQCAHSVCTVCVQCARRGSAEAPVRPLPVLLLRSCRVVRGGGGRGVGRSTAKAEGLRLAPPLSIAQQCIATQRCEAMPVRRGRRALAPCSDSIWRSPCESGAIAPDSSQRLRLRRPLAPCTVCTQCTSHSVRRTAWAAQCYAHCAMRSRPALRFRSSQS